MKAHQARAVAQVQNPCAQNPTPPERRRLYRDDARRDQALAAETAATPPRHCADGGNSASSVPCRTGKPREKFFSRLPYAKNSSEIIDLLIRFGNN
jgi:hypothetical protein